MIYFDKNKEAFAFEIDDYICKIEDELWEQYACTDKWDIIDGVFTDITDTEEWKEKEREREQARIKKLKCTKRVFVLMLEELGLDYYENILPLIEMNRNAKLEWDLCVELLRSNPMIDLIASKLGVTPEQIDRLFLYANGKVDTLKENK